MKIGDKIIFIEDVKSKNLRVMVRAGQTGTITTNCNSRDEYKVKIEGKRYICNHVPASSIRLPQV